MDLGILELVLVISVEDDAVLFNEGHHGRLPSWRSQEVNDNVEEPVLLKIQKLGLTFSPSAGGACAVLILFKFN